MSGFRLTPHAVQRIAQRALRVDDLELIEAIGTEVEGGAIILRKDAKAVEREVKQFLDRVWRLVGKRYVADGKTVITAYHASRSKERRLLRRA